MSCGEPCAQQWRPTLPDLASVAAHSGGVGGTADVGEDDRLFGEGLGEQRRRFGSAGRVALGYSAATTRARGGACSAASRYIALATAAPEPRRSPRACLASVRACPPPRRHQQPPDSGVRPPTEPTTSPRAVQDRVDLEQRAAGQGLDLAPLPPASDLVMRPTVSTRWLHVLLHVERPRSEIGPLSWSRLGESNPRPTHYECVALTD
jgi:hypothetical protein